MAREPQAVMCHKAPKFQCKFADASDRKNYWLNVWSIEDVKNQALKDDIELTDEQAQEVLAYFENHYDYVWEVSWELMDTALEECQKDWQKKAEERKVQANGTNFR